MHRNTHTVTAGYDARAHHNSVKPPLYATSTFSYPSAQHAKDVHEAYFRATPPDHTPAEPNYIYARLDHPNLTMLQARLAALDGAEDAACFNCGMAAINAVTQAFLRPGDTVLHTKPIYGGTDGLLYTHLIRFGITPIGIADALDETAIRTAAQDAAARGRLALVMVETPANPTSGVADIALIARIAAEIGHTQGHRPLVVVDNTFLGPFQQNPLAHGADLCMTSLTKYAGGHSDLLAGGVSGAAGLVHTLKQLRTLLGSQLDAHTSWMVLRSLETMHLRTERAGDNAAAIAHVLRGHPAVASVNYVGFQRPGSRAYDAFTRQCRGAGSTFTFRIRGGEPAAFRMLDRLRVIHMAVSLGGTETLICHPATTTHFNVPEARRLEVGIDSDTLRISVGVEHEDDLIGDLRQALAAIPLTPETLSAALVPPNPEAASSASAPVMSPTLEASFPATPALQTALEASFGATAEPTPTPATRAPNDTAISAAQAPQSALVASFGATAGPTPTAATRASQNTAISAAQTPQTALEASFGAPAAFAPTSDAHVAPHDTASPASMDTASAGDRPASQAGSLLPEPV